jgi:hypothetical protein
MADYILFDDRNADGSKDKEGHFVFANEADAQAFLDSKTGGSADSDTITDNKFTTTYLNGKTFYLVAYDDFGYDDIGEKWNMAKMVFTTSSFTWKEYNTPDTNEHTFNYTITDDGKISYVFTEDSSDTGLISVASVEDDYIKVCEDGDCNTYMFFDETKAQEFADSHNGGGADSSDLASLIDGKTLYIASQKTFEKLTFQFDDNKVSVIGSEDFDEPMDYEIDSGGNLIISGSKFTYVSDNDDYIEIIATNTPSSFVEDTEMTDWIESSFGISVSSFENNATKLKDWFLENGLWDTTITADGKINKYDGVLCDGYWYIENNIFYFAYPEEDHLGFKAYKVENNQLLKQTDAPYSETVRFYYDQAERDAWYNTLISN